MNPHHTPLPDDPLAEELSLTMADLDQWLANRQRFGHLSLQEARGMLTAVDRFQQRLLALETDRLLDHSLSSPPLSAARWQRLISAGCRLCADVSEAITMRLVDVLQDKQHSIDFLNQSLREKVRDQHQARQLLQQTQAVKNQTQDLGQRAGLSVL